MRIITRVTAGGGRSLTRFPAPHDRMADCLGADGRVDAVKAQMAFAAANDGEHRSFVGASKDDVRVYAASMVFCEAMTDSLGEVAARKDNDCSTRADTKADRKNVEKDGKDKVVLVVNEVRRVSDGVRVRIWIDNSGGVMGDAELEARYFAVAAAQMWLKIAEQFAWVRLDAPEFADEARRKNAEAMARQANDARMLCGHWRNGYCTADKDGNPPDFRCRHYCKGKCVEIGADFKDNETKEQADGK